ncbi:MAG: sugar phosphate isomerase/epimerase family protein [Limisphaerales bacterium]
MNATDHQTSRRAFLKSAALATGALALAPAAFADAPKKLNVKLGLDNFSVRAMKWNASQLIDYAAKLKTDSLFLTDLDCYENFNDGYLRDLKKKADDLGLQIHVGSWSICPTSKVFKKKWGTAEDHVALGIRVAKALGSPVFRCVLGTGEDRFSEGGIEARIADTVKVCRASRSRAMDAGVKIAIENHAGDMQSWELVQLIEEAGKDYVAANIDSGNACWTMEDPLQNLEVLAPYVATTSLRDSMVWESANGATVQWTAMGEGNVDVKTYFNRFAELCPGIPVHIETISGFARETPYWKPDFWKVWPKMPAKNFARFLVLAKTGKPLPAAKANDPDYQRDQIERSLKYCKEVLGLGLK